MNDEEGIRTFHMVKEARDEYTGEKLEANLVHKAKLEELAYFKSKSVWQVVPRTRARGQRVVGTRWVNSNKGDSEHP